MAPEIVEVYWNLNVDGGYERFICDLRKKLADHPEQPTYITKYGGWLEEHPLLPLQIHPQEPARWMHINLVAYNKKTRMAAQTTIAVRDDNVYLIGFMNGNGKWYEFGSEKRNIGFIKGSTFLGCDVSYGELFKGSAENLVGLRVGKFTAIDAVCMLSEYGREGQADHAATRVCLARMCVMICESARMIPHFKIVTQGWNDERRRISGEHAAYMKNWNGMSRKLLSTLDPSPERKRLLAVVYLLLNSPDKKKGTQKHQQEQSPTSGAGESSQGPGGSNPEIPPSSGPATGSSGSSSSGAQEQQGQTGGKTVVHTRPLVEVFSVTLQPAYIGSIRTVAVFDGKRGQIIYKHGGGRLGPDSMYVNQLQLIGPYKAISAEGSFAIQVSDESSNVLIGEMLWDCYTDNVKYDEIQFGDIPIRTGTGQDTIAKVGYAVWSDAVEATVEVNLLLPAVTRVSGEITARYGSSYANGVVLFKGGWDDRMGPLELRRSVIAVPLLSRYSRVTIHVDLREHLWGLDMDGAICFYLDKHSGEIRIEQEGNIFVPMGWTRGSDVAVGGGATSPAIPQRTMQNIRQRAKVQVNMTSPGFHLSPLQPDDDWRKHRERLRTKIPSGPTLLRTPRKAGVS